MNNGKGSPPSGGQQPEKQSSFGEVKNQGRNSYSQNSENNVGRNRSNAVFHAPTGRERANAVFQPPTTRDRSGGISNGPPGFNQVKNAGRSQGQQAPQGQQSGISQLKEMLNQGRNAYKSSKDNRSGLTPNQQAGFSLVSGFMEKLMKEADRSNSQSSDPGFKRSNQGQGNGFNQQQQEEEKRRLSIQSTQRDDDEDISAGDFFKRLNSAMKDPEKFKREAAQRTAAKQEKTQPPPQTRQRGGTILPGSDMPNPLNDPGGFKRRQSHQQSQPQPNGPGKHNSEKMPQGQQLAQPGKTQQQRPPGGRTTGPGKQQNQQQSQPQGVKSKPSFKPSPRKK